jgi:hypothetical protein
MAKGFGTGNCFYEGVKDTAAVGAHRFQCHNVGALAKDSKL